MMHSYSLFFSCLVTKLCLHYFNFEFILPFYMFKHVIIKVVDAMHVKMAHAYRS